VEVALDSAPLRICGGDYTGSGCAQLFGPLPKLVKGFLQCKIEPPLVDCNTHLASQFFKGGVRLVGETLAVTRSLRQDHAEQLSSLAHRRDPDGCLSA
jgi:hypothetical protein